VAVVDGGRLRVVCKMAVKLFHSYFLRNNNKKIYIFYVFFKK
jgi:hypothetical protein